MTTMTVTDAKSKFLSLLRKSHDVGEVFSVTHNGVPYAVIMGQEDYDGLLETIDILQDKVFARDLMDRVHDADKGKTVAFEKVAGRSQRK
jgi:prevent-host-death family protein